ncbi:MAG: hypothetical protein WBC91_13485 [Phototrophicaceae bacterium]
MMSHYDDVYEFDEKPKRKRNEDPTTWGDAWRAIGIFVGAGLAVGISFFFLQRLILGEKYDTYFDITINASGLQGIDNSLVNGYFEGLANPLVALLGIVLSILLTVLALFVIFGIVHSFSTKVLNGDGTLRGLMARAMPITTWVYLSYSIVAGIWGIFSISATVERFAGVNIAASTAMANEYSQFVLSQSGLLYAVGFIAWLVWGVLTSFKTSETYGITKNKGCVSLILTNATIFGLFCGCIFAFSFALVGLTI